MTETTNRIQTVDGLQDMLLEAADLAGRLAACAREQDDRKAPEKWKRGWTPTLETTEAMLRAQAGLIDSVIGRSLKQVNWPEELDMALHRVKGRGPRAGPDLRREGRNEDPHARA